MGFLRWTSGGLAAAGPMCHVFFVRVVSCGSFIPQSLKAVNESIALATLSSGFSLLRCLNLLLDFIRTSKASDLEWFQTHVKPLGFQADSSFYNMLS